MENLSGLTIIVLSYNRQPYLLRQMEFWNGTPVKLHVLDGTDAKIPSSETSRFHEGIVYHHVPASVYERMFYARDLIDTPYATFLADDNFFVPSALSSCITHIEEDGLIACLGMALNIFFKDDHVYAKNRDPSIRDFSVEEEGSRERMMKIGSNAIPIVYAVHRRDAFLNHLLMYPDNVTSCPVSAEIQYRLLTAFQGKVKVIDELMWLNSYENTAVTTAGWSRRNDAVTWYRNPEMASEVQAFFRAMMDVLTKLGNDDEQKLLADLKAAVSVYMSSKEDRKKRLRRGGMLSSMIAAICDCVPDVAKQVVRQCVPAVIRDKVNRSFVPLSVMGQSLFSQGTVVDFEQLAAIEKNICSFYAHKR